MAYSPEKRQKLIYHRVHRVKNAGEGTNPVKTVRAN